MSEEPKKWKRGDIGPDGRIFWTYNKSRPGGIRWIANNMLEKCLEAANKGARAYRQKNREKCKDRQRSYYEKNRGKYKDRIRSYYEKNREKYSELQRRRILMISFKKQDGSSLQSWRNSLTNKGITYKTLAYLTPDPGQTLAELIHELSGYPMEVCEQIANPPEPEILDNPEPPANVNPGPDLF